MRLFTPSADPTDPGFFWGNILWFFQELKGEGEAAFTDHFAFWLLEVQVGDLQRISLWAECLRSGCCWSLGFSSCHSLGSFWSSSLGCHSAVPLCCHCLRPLQGFPAWLCHSGRTALCAHSCRTHPSHQSSSLSWSVNLSQCVSYCILHLQNLVRFSF